MFVPARATSDHMFCFVRPASATSDQMSCFVRPASATSDHMSCFVRLVWADKCVLLYLFRAKMFGPEPKSLGRPEWVYPYLSQLILENLYKAVKLFYILKVYYLNKTCIISDYVILATTARSSTTDAIVAPIS
jgi:hypothetical protein